MKYQQFTFPVSGNARARHVAHFLGVHISTVWRYAKRPDFPKPHGNPPIFNGGNKQN